MANWFLDYESGSDNNSGDSFNVDLTGASLISNGTTTVTSVGGGFTGLSGRKIYLVTTAAGRTISSITNDTTAVLNASVGAATQTFNVGGRRRLLSAMNTTTCAAIGAGDVIRHKGSLPPTSLSVDTFWVNLSPTVMLVGTTRTDVSTCESNWTASANVTSALNASDFKEGSNSVQLTVAAGFTTGLAAYFATGTLDLSSKQIVTFWIKQTSGTLSANASIRLCSDTAGVTSVNTCTLPTLTKLNEWFPIAIDFGSALGASIQSVAFYIGTDQAAQTFLIDAVKACNAPNLTKSVCDCNSAWTASANVTATTSTTRREGANSASLSVAAGFTTGLAAYFPTGTLDLSGYRQISFWILQTTGTLLATGGMSLRLCSDAVGVTTVNTIVIPPLTGSAVNVWHNITVDTGGALGASIASIALYVDTDAGAQLVLIDNIIACKDSTGNDAITLQSLLGNSSSLGAGGDDSETFYRPRSIINNTLIIDTSPNSSAATASRGFSGTSVISTGYRLEPIKTTYVAVSATDVNLMSNTLAGTFGNPVTISGGWDRTDMSTQTLQSWFSGGNGLGYGMRFHQTSHIAINRHHFVAYGAAGLRVGAISNCAISTVTGNCCTTDGIQLYYGGNFDVATTITGNNNGSHGIRVSNVNVFLIGVKGRNNANAGVAGGGNTVEIRDAYLTNNAGNGWNFNSFACTIAHNMVTDNNVQGGITASTGWHDLFNCTINETTEVVAMTAYGGGRLRSTRHDNTDDNHWTFYDGGTCNSQSSVRHTASGIAWQMNPTSTNRYVGYPLVLSLGEYAVPSGSTTIKAWLRRTNTGLTMSLVVPGHRLPGMTNDATASMTAAADTWEEVSLSISPTSKGVVEVLVHAYGGTTYTGYVDDLTVGGVAQTLDYGWNGQPWGDPPVNSASTTVVINKVTNVWMTSEDDFNA